MADNYGVSDLTEEEISKLQYDILYTSTENNLYLSSSPIDSLNKALRTENKRVILAINELLRDTKSALDATNEFKLRFNSIIGDEIADPSLLANLREIDTNFFKVVYKLYKNATINPEEVNKQFDRLNKDVENLINQINVHYSEEEFHLNSGLENITLTKTPWSKSCVFIFINGVYYPTSFFNVSNNIITWLKNDEFHIDGTDTIIVKYHYIEYTREDEEESP